MREHEQSREELGSREGSLREPRNASLLCEVTKAGHKRKTISSNNN